MSRIVVADAGPLIALARIGRIELLRLLYGGAVVPVAVMEELQLASRRPGADALRAARNAGWLEVMTAPTDVHALKQVLDAGEAEAILLAENIACRFLLIDERRGRAIARHRGIPVVGTAGLLLNAKRKGRLEAVTPELERLSQNGYRLAPALVEEIRRLAGE
jgi:predicted nucleic acid-binding protein